MKLTPTKIKERAAAERAAAERIQLSIRERRIFAELDKN